jgi:GNAT superfamily N-acetyltransferase
VFRPNLPVLVNARAGVTVSCGTREKTVIGSGAALETDNTIAFGACPPGFRRLGPEDAPLFETIEDDFSEFNLVAQTKEFLSESTGGTECFGMFAEGTLAAFASAITLRGSMFAESYSISGIFTARHFRKQGCAAALLRGILQAYPGKRFHYTACPATNIASVRLARSCGFRPVGETTAIQFT